MTIKHHAEKAIHTLDQAFAPLRCQFMPINTKDSFSFAVIDEHGVARRSERLYPEQYLADGSLQRIIERTRRALVA